MPFCCKKINMPFCCKTSKKLKYAKAAVFNYSTSNSISCNNYSTSNSISCNKYSTTTTNNNITTIHEVTQAKKNLTIQIQHWEKIKNITKDPKEIEEIQDKIHKLRIDFLCYGSESF